MFDGFDLPFFFGGTGSYPDFSAADPGAAIPQPLPEQVAQHLATQGISPAQFMANPKAFEVGASPLAYPPAGGQHTNPMISGSSAGTAQPAFAFPDRTPVQPKPVQTLSYAPPGSPQEAPPDSPGYNYSQQTATAKPEATQEMSAKGKGNDVAKNLTDTLKGVQALQPPTPQRVYTPSPINPGHATAGAVKSGQLAALLNLIAGKQGTPSIPLPLGAVLAGRT